jgi:hypothetical protein
MPKLPAYRVCGMLCFVTSIYSCAKPSVYGGEFKGNTMKTSLFSTWAALALSASLLGACGGGGGAAPAAAAASSNAGIAGMSNQVETAASFALDGLDAGFYGLPKGAALSAPTQFETPAAVSVHPAPTCSSGTVTSTSSAVDVTNLRYTNCVINGSTLNGTITTAGPTAYTANGVWTSTFAGFSVSAPGADGKTVKFNYSGNQVFKDMTWSGAGAAAEATAGKATMNVDIVVDNGSSTIKLTNFLINFTYNTTSKETTLNMSGKFGYDLKLADFGVPATPGLPATINIEFDVTTPSTLKFTDTTDSGVYKLASAVYTIEIDYTNDVAKFTAGGVTQTFPLQ